MLLSLTYVLAMAATYTIAGMLAALLGQNMQIVVSEFLGTGRVQRAVRGAVTVDVRPV
jgi:hypothetical protein